MTLYNHNNNDMKIDISISTIHNDNRWYRQHIYKRNKLDSSPQALYSPNDRRYISKLFFPRSEPRSLHRLAKRHLTRIIYLILISYSLLTMPSKLNTNVAMMRSDRGEVTITSSSRYTSTNDKGHNFHILSFRTEPSRYHAIHRLSRRHLMTIIFLFLLSILLPKLPIYKRKRRQPYQRNVV